MAYRAGEPAGQGETGGPALGSGMVTECSALTRWRSTWGQSPPQSPVPTAVAVFPGDTTIRPLAERAHNVVHWAEFSRGGHFAAMEAPDLLVSEMREFFRQFR